MAEKYLCATFDVSDPVQADLLTGQLSLLGFDGFEQDDAFLRAYMPADAVDMTGIQASLQSLGLPYRFSIEEEKNWNALWEASFQPLTIADAVHVRAKFHPPVKDVRFDIIITPKMSFGTGHHATTALMIEAMLPIQFSGKKVLDFGTGTGILAILAEKLGSDKVLAIDYDHWSIQNALENIRENACDRVTIRQQDKVQSEQAYDVILANINRNIILDQMESMTAALQAGGLLLLSGILQDDFLDISVAVAGQGLEIISQKSNNQWLMLVCKSSG